MDMMMLPGTVMPGWAEPLEFGETIVLHDLPNNQYHGTRALISKSGLDVAARSLAHYAHYLTEIPEDDGDSEALVIGSALHSLVLEPMVFRREFVLLPDFGDMRSSTNRAMRDTWLRNEHPGKKPLKRDQWQMIHDMRESLFRNRRIRAILENGRPEVTCAALCPHTGLPLKIRMDWESEIDGVACDLKSALDASPSVWRRAAANMRYHVQDAYYTNVAQLCGRDVRELSFAVIEKEPPYVAGLYTLNPTARAAGEIAYTQQLAQIAEACETGEFPGYGGGGVVELSLPKYAVADAETVP